MQDNPDTSQIVDEISADLITPLDMSTSIQRFTPVADNIEMTALGFDIAPRI